MKKSLKVCQILLLLIIFLCSSLGLNYVYAADIVATGEWGDNITWTLDSDGTLTITGDGDMYTEQMSDSPWIDYKDQVKNVVFNGNITSISNRAFQAHTNLKSITLPDSITEIGLRAFAECPNLETVNMPKNLVRIGMGAFINCTALKSVELPERLMYIGEYAFDGCTSLKTLTVQSDIALFDERNVLPSTLEQIYGYKYSGVYYYARHNGVNFTDLTTDESYTGQISNESYLELLPTENLILGVVQNHSNYGNPSQESLEFCNEKLTENETYKEMKALVDELTVDCATEKDKAKAITLWVIQNMRDGGRIGASASTTSIYAIFEELSGNCECYTMLTNYMLFLANIPTATVRNLTHEWSAAFVDGEWIYIDTTHNRFDSYDSEAYEVLFAYNGGMYLISDPADGMKLVKTLDISTECEHLNKTTHEAVTSTCLTQGNAEYVTCDDCGKVISGSAEKLPLADHNYGELIARVEPEHDENGIKDGVEAHYKCSVCGKLFNENKEEVTEEDLVIKEPGHSYGEDWTNDIDYHWKQCGCGNIVEQEAHRGGEATCSEQATCEVCGVKYGNLNPNNHKNTGLINEKEATCQEEGYTGDTYCNDCKKTVKTGTTIEKTDHKGGEATCVSKAKCEVCGTEYGEIDSTNHKNTETRNAVEATCTADGYTGDTYCADCDTKLEDGEVIKAEGHKGGEATCVDKAVCEVCKQEYGEIDSTNHKNTETRNAVEVTCTTDGYTGDTYCADCDTKLENGEVIKAEGHTGGEATCIAKAKCEVCGTEYGEIDSTNHKNTELINEKEVTCTEDGYTGDTYCNDCDTVVENGTTITAIGHKGGEATCVSKAKCEVCGLEYGEIDSTNHKNTEIRNAVEATTETEGYTGDVYCTDCNKLVKAGEVIPVITTDPEEPTDDETKPTEPSEDETKPSTDDEKEEVKPVEDEKETTNEAKPQTDDNSNMTLWISLLVISGISFVAIARCNTKRKVSKHSK